MILAEKHERPSNLDWKTAIYSYHPDMCKYTVLVESLKDQS